VSFSLKPIGAIFFIKMPRCEGNNWDKRIFCTIEYR